MNIVFILNMDMTFNKNVNMDVNIFNIFQLIKDEEIYHYEN